MQPESCRFDRGRTNPRLPIAYARVSCKLQRDRTQNRRPLLLIALLSHRRIRQNGGVVLVTRYFATRCTITEALVPPKPKEFDRATLISRLRGFCGTRSIAVSTEGLSRLMGG